MRKIFTLLMVLMSLSMYKANVYAQSGDGWSLEGGVLTISSNAPKLEVDPAVSYGKNWYDMYADQVTEVVFDENVTSITDDVSSDNYVSCTSFENLRKVTIGPNVENIGDRIAEPLGSSGVFRGCKNLAVVEFQQPSQLKKIGASTFFSSAIKNITIPASVEEIGDQAFMQCSQLTSITWEAGSALRTIGKQTFSSCSALESVVLPQSIESVGDLAFSDSRALKSVSIEGTPTALQSLGEGTFNYCEALESVPTIPAAQTSMGEMFYLCGNLKSVEFAENSQLESIADNAFLKSGIESIVIPKNVKSIGQSAFESCPNLVSIEFEEGSVLETIGNQAFRYTTLQSITFPDGLKTIGNSAFLETQLKEIDIPASVTSIESLAFMNNEVLTKATFRGSESPTIEPGASIFRDCNSLANIYVPVGATGYEESLSQYKDLLRYTLEPTTPPASDGTIVDDKDYIINYTEDGGWTYQEGESGTPIPFSGTLTGTTTGTITIQSAPTDENLTFAEGAEVGTLKMEDGVVVQVEGSVKIGSFDGNGSMLASDDATISGAAGESLKEVSIETTSSEEETGTGSTPSADVAVSMGDVNLQAGSNVVLPENTKIDIVVTNIQDGYDVESVTVGGNAATAVAAKLLTRANDVPLKYTYTITGKETDLAVVVSLKAIETPEPTKPAAPTINGETPFDESTTVTITATEGATIYYTTDGNDPTTSSTKYTEAITLTETTTIKAIAVVDGVASNVSEKTFTKQATEEPDPEEPEDPDTPVIPDYPDYYNIYVDECEGVTVETSTDVVREGNSMNFTIEVADGYTAEDMVVKVKRSMFGYTEIIEPNEDGKYEIHNIWTEIYITVEGVEKENPTGIEEITESMVYAQDGSIYVQTPKQEQVRIISISGAVVKNETQIGLKRYDLPRSIYIIGIGEERMKIRN